MHKHKSIVTIDYPVAGQACPWAQEVRGRFIHAHNIQTMVLAADNRWYPQPRLKKHGKRYSGTVYLGFETCPNAQFYTIAVGTGGPYIKEPVDELPSETLWTYVAVERIP